MSFPKSCPYLKALILILLTRGWVKWELLSGRSGDISEWPSVFGYVWPKSYYEWSSGKSCWSRRQRVCNRPWTRLRLKWIPYSQVVKRRITALKQFIDLKKKKAKRYPEINNCSDGTFSAIVDWRRYTVQAIILFYLLFFWLLLPNKI